MIASKMTANMNKARLSREATFQLGYCIIQFSTIILFLYCDFLHVNPYHDCWAFIPKVPIKVLICISIVLMVNLGWESRMLVAVI